MVLLTLLLIYNGFGIFSEGKEKVLFMYANLTTFSFWVVFMMGAIFVSILGRFFCSICPVGEINHFFSKLGFKKNLNTDLDFLQGFSILIVFVLVIVFHFSRHPHLTSLLILFVVILSALIGILFKSNSFCMILCPANAFLRFYSRFSLFKISCKENSAYSPCMVMLNPCNVKKERCHLCFRCFKNGQGIYIKKDVSTSDSTFTFSSSEIFIFSVLSGLTVMAFIRVVPEIRELFVYPPYLLSQLLGLHEQYIIFLLIIFGGFIYPACFYGFIVFMVKVSSQDKEKFLSRKVLPFFIPLIMSVHFILAITKLNTRLGFLRYNIFDPTGKDMIALYGSGKIELPGDIISINTLKYVIVLLPTIAILYSLYFTCNQLKKRSDKIVLATFQFSFFIFIEYCILNWLFKGFSI